MPPPPASPDANWWQWTIQAVVMGVMGIVAHYFKTLMNERQKTEKQKMEEEIELLETRIRLQEAQEKLHKKEEDL